jgi:hypothetical protein
MFRRLAFAGIAAVLFFSAALSNEKNAYAGPLQPAESAAEKAVSCPIHGQITGLQSARNSDGSAGSGSCMRFRFALAGATLVIASDWSSTGTPQSLAISAWYHREPGDFAVRLLIAGPHLLLELPPKGSSSQSI